VRGTTFAVQVGANEATDVLVYEGEVEVRAGEQSVGVKQGQTIAVAKTGDTSLRELSEQERAEGEQALADLSGAESAPKSGPPPSG
jgi:ferric-dicitrate binding protein FerR (iron transport regulator)